jgi:hypothetical protein
VFKYSLTTYGFKHKNSCYWSTRWFAIGGLFATKHSVIGFDINEARVAELKSGHDATLEIDSFAF